MSQHSTLTDLAHKAHMAHKATELAMRTPQGQAVAAAATGIFVATAPIAVPIVVTTAVGYGLFWGFRKLGEMLNS